MRRVGTTVVVSSLASGDYLMKTTMTLEQYLPPGDAFNVGGTLYPVTAVPGGVGFALAGLAGLVGRRKRRG